jgi:asparagine synthetase B (glutamine-hydrolysing)
MTNPAEGFPGEIYSGLDIEPHANDGAALLASFTAAAAAADAAADHESEFDPGAAISRAHARGPFAFAFWHAATSALLFGRDALGRRSLLAARCGTRGLLLSSSAGPAAACDG